MVFARGRIVVDPWPLATDPFRTLLEAAVALLATLSLRFRGREEGVVVI